jgi:hypothetical protein
MKKKADTVRYTAKQIAAKRARGESRTDWARVDAMSQGEVERLAHEEDGELEKGCRPLDRRFAKIKLVE